MTLNFYTLEGGFWGEGGEILVTYIEVEGGKERMKLREIDERERERERQRELKRKKGRKRERVNKKGEREIGMREERDWEGV